VPPNGQSPLSRRLWSLTRVAEFAVGSFRKSLNLAVKRKTTKVMERKRRLGHYAVVSKNGRLRPLKSEEIKPLAAAEEQAS